MEFGFGGDEVVLSGTKASAAEEATDTTETKAARAVGGRAGGELEAAEAVLLVATGLQFAEPTRPKARVPVSAPAEEDEQKRS